MPLSKIVILDVGILAEQSFHHVPRIVKDEDDGLQSAPAELTDLLGRQLMRAFTRNQHNPTVRRRDCCTKGRRSRISNGTPQRLVVKLRALRQECKRQSIRRTPGLSKEDIVRFDEICPAREPFSQTSIRAPLRRTLTRRGPSISVTIALTWEQRYIRTLR